MAEIVSTYNFYALDHGYSAEYDEWRVAVDTACFDEDGALLPDDQWLRRCMLDNGGRYVAAAWEYDQKPPVETYVRQMCDSMERDGHPVPPEMRDTLREVISREP